MNNFGSLQEQEQRNHFSGLHSKTPKKKTALSTGIGTASIKKNGNL